MEDLPELVRHYLQRFSRELGKEVQTASPEALAFLQRYPWPGNIRELQSVLKQSLLHATGPVLVPAFLPTAIQNGAPPKALAPGTMDLERQIQDRIQAGSQDLYAEMLALMERQLLTQVLRATQGNQLQAAKILGITRGSLRTKIRALGITIERAVLSEDDPTE
jgi:two-component system nitrogen regulation response regulator GlnG